MQSYGPPGWSEFPRGWRWIVPFYIYLMHLSTYPRYPFLSALLHTSMPSAYILYHCQSEALQYITSLICAHQHPTFEAQVLLYPIRLNFLLALLALLRPPILYLFQHTLVARFNLTLSRISYAISSSKIWFIHSTSVKCPSTLFALLEGCPAGELKVL